MLNPSEKAYCLALQALKDKQYRLAEDYFEKAATFFENNQEFNLLWESTRLLLAVKEEIAATEGDNDTLIIEEVFSDGQDTELRRQSPRQAQD